MKLIACDSVYNVMPYYRVLLFQLNRRHMSSSVYTRRDIAARCRGAMDAENGLQRNQQGRLH